MNKFYTFVMRVILGGVFAVILSRFFYPDAKLIYAMGLGIFLVGMAYVVEYLRHRKHKL